MFIQLLFLSLLNLKIEIMKTFKITLLIASVLILNSCADVGPNINECVTNEAYGFWSGLWHGFISPLSFLGSLLSDDIAFYAYNNNGGWYNFGFALGAGIITIGGAKSSK